MSVFNKTGIINTYPLQNKNTTKIYKEPIVINPNIAKNTYFTTNYSSYATVDNSFLFNGLPTLKISTSGNTSNTYRGYSQTLTGLKAGDVITVSVWVYKKDDNGIDNGCEMRIYQTHNDGSANNWSGFTPSNSTWVNNEWLFLKKTYTLDSNFASAVLSFDVVRNGTYWLSSPKVEFGTDATPWVPDESSGIYTIEANNFYEV